MFIPVELVWKDHTYTILPDRVLGAIAVIEGHLTMSELAQEAQSGHLRLARLSRTFGALLRYAGSRVTDDEIYAELFRGEPGEVRQRIIDSVNILMALMVPPDLGAAPRGNGSEKPGNSPMAAVKSSRRSTRRSSARAG